MIYVFSLNQYGQSNTLWIGNADTLRGAIQAAIEAGDITSPGVYFAAKPNEVAVNIQHFTVRGLEVV